MHNLFSTNVALKPPSPKWAPPKAVLSVKSRKAKGTPTAVIAAEKLTTFVAIVVNEEEKIVVQVVQHTASVPEMFNIENILILPRALEERGHLEAEEKIGTG